MKIIILSALLWLGTFPLFAQSEQAIERAQSEIKATFGQMPEIFAQLPEAALPGFWAYFQSAANPNAAIPPKYRELIQLGVAAQIPCDFCVFYHTESAKAFGATDAEIKEAIYSAAATRNYSTLLYGNQTDLESFKKSMRDMMAFMAEQMDKNE